MKSQAQRRGPSGTALETATLATTGTPTETPTEATTGTIAFRSLFAITRATLRAAILVACAVLPALGTGPGPREFVIQNVRIFDGQAVIPRGEVWVKDGKIKAVGARVHAPAELASINGEGETLLPGLIDAHVHVYGNALQEALVFGVTTELDMFTDHSLAADLKREQAAGMATDRADLYSAGTLVTAPNGHGTEFGITIPTITGPADAQAFVDARIAEGSDYIKIVYDNGSTYGREIPTLSRETMAAVVAAAHKRHKLTVAHIGSLAGAHDAIEAGVDGLAHLFVDTRADEGFAELVRSHHAFVVPTLSVLASMSGQAFGDTLTRDERLRPYLSPTTVAGLKASFGHAVGKLAYAEETVRQLESLHVPILAGTDAPNPGTAHGASVHEELALLVESGLTPLEALRAATSTPARSFHLEDRGRIEKGKRADLLLVRGDPTTDITATRDIVAVWKQGIEADRASVLVKREAERKAEDAQKTTPAPSGSESGLISDFESGAADSRFGLGWSPSTDQIIGGKSSAEIKIVEDGAAGSGRALEVQGDVVSGSVSWAGAIFFPGSEPMSPVNLSARKAISFWAKGNSETCQLMVYSRTGGYIPKMRAFAVGPEWTKVTLPFAAFGTDGHDLTGVLIGVSSTPGPFRILVDGVQLE